MMSEQHYHEVKLELGSKAPDFSLPSISLGVVSTITSSDLLGRPYILYFYPKAATPGCTVQACAVRDILPEIKALPSELSAIDIFGVSPDTPHKLACFIEKQALNFTLLSDEMHDLAKSYGVWGEKKLYGRSYMGIIRSSFLIDAEGKIAAFKKPIRPAEQSEWIKEILKIG